MKILPNMMIVDSIKNNYNTEILIPKPDRFVIIFYNEYAVGVINTIKVDYWDNVFSTE